MATKVINSLTFGSGTYVITLPYATCSTAAATQAKVATITPGSNFSLETGARVSVKFDAANSASSPTLNVNQSGAKTIRFRGASLTSSLFYWAAGSVVDFVYDGTYWNMTGSPHSNTRYTLSSFGITASATELNYTDGVTSNIQTQLNARTVKRTSDGTSYLQLGTYYASGSTAKYVKISFPAVPSWTMVTLELTIRENYNSQYSGKLIIYANQSSAADWALSAFADGTLTTAIKVYGSDKQHIYVEGLSSWGGLSLDRMLIGDSATSSDLTNMTLTGVTALPTTYQTATMYYGVHSGNIGSQSVNYANSAGAVAWGNVSSKPSYYDAKAITSISRSGTTFTATYLDGTTATFSQQDNNTNTAHSHTAGDGISLSGSGGTSGTTTISLAASGVTASSYGPSANASPAHSGTFSVPYITVDTYGRITSASTKTITLPASGNTDTKVTQAAAITATTSANYPVMLGYSTATSAVTNTLNKSAKLLFDTGTGALTVGSGSSAGSGTLTVDGDIIAGGGSDSYGIHPKTSNYSTLGKSNKYWYKVYSANVYTNSLKKLDGTDYSFTMTWNTF